jgi:D-alanyl-D-alanine carboxypeptidase
MDMTNLMVATISLEFLTQDTSILGTDGLMTTRKNLLPQLIKNKDTSISHLYAKSIGEDLFIKYMNQKALALGLTSTHFTSVDDPVTVTYEDYIRFMTYITTYKSYLRTLEN